MAKFLVLEGHYSEMNHKRVARIIQEHKINAKVRQRCFPSHYYRSLKENPVTLPQNILDRDFKAEGPMQKLVTDITYMPTDRGWPYLATVKDLWNNETVSHELAQHISLGQVKKVIRKLVKGGNDLHGVLIHSDMGWTYTNKIY